MKIRTILTATTCSIFFSFATTYAQTEGNLSLAAPYEVVASHLQTIWIFSEEAKTSEQCAATVFAAAKKIKDEGTTRGPFSVVLAIDPHLTGDIPNASFGLYMARASLETKKFVDGQWLPEENWKVFATTQPKTEQLVQLLKRIYAAAEEQNLTDETDYVSFISKKDNISIENAEQAVRKAINLGTPGKPFQF